MDKRRVSYRNAESYDRWVEALIFCLWLYLCQVGKMVNGGGVSHTVFLGARSACRINVYNVMHCINWMTQRVIIPANFLKRQAACSFFCLTCCPCFRWELRAVLDSAITYKYYLIKVIIGLDVHSALIGRTRCTASSEFYRYILLFWAEVVCTLPEVLAQANCT